MPLVPSLIGLVAAIIDKVISDQQARDLAKLELVQLQGTQEMEAVEQRLAAMIAEANDADRWTSRARPSFLYVMYALILWALPMGLIGAMDPSTAKSIAQAVGDYLAALPEPLYVLFGTGYLGYTVSRQWGKIAGSDK